jgi:hypothetical protein
MLAFYRYGARELLGVVVENDGCVVSIRGADGGIIDIPIGCVIFRAA